MKTITLEFLGKFIFNRTNLIKQKEELKENLVIAQGKINLRNKTENEKKLDELINNFLNFDKFNKIYLYRLINKIEIDKDKNVYIYFNFPELNFMNEDLGEFINVKNCLSNNLK